MSIWASIESGLKNRRRGGRSSGPIHRGLALACAALLTVPLAALLAGCATQQPVPPPDDTTRAGTSTISGRLSVRYADPASGQEEAMHGRFEWRQHDGQVELALRNPLGQSIAVIESGTGGSRLTLSDGRRFEGATPEDLSASVLGWTVPVRGLAHWLRGRAAPHAASHTIPAEVSVQTNANGSTESISQDGWTIRYAYRNASEPPSRIDLTYPGPGVAIELRLAIDRRVMPATPDPPTSGETPGDADAPGAATLP